MKMKYRTVKIDRIPTGLFGWKPNPKKPSWSSQTRERGDAEWVQITESPNEDDAIKACARHAYNTVLHELQLKAGYFPD